MIAQIHSVKDKTCAAFASAMKLEGFCSEIQTQNFTTFELFAPLIKGLYDKLEQVNKKLPDYTGLAIYAFSSPQQEIQNLMAVCSKMIEQGIKTPDMLWFKCQISDLKKPPIINLLKEYLINSIKTIIDAITFIFQFCFDPHARALSYSRIVLTNPNLRDYRGY